MSRFHQKRRPIIGEIVNTVLHPIEAIENAVAFGTGNTISGQGGNANDPEIAVDQPELARSTGSTTVSSSSANHLPTPSPLSISTTSTSEISKKADVKSFQQKSASSSSSTTSSVASKSSAAPLSTIPTSSTSPNAVPQSTTPIKESSSSTTLLNHNPPQSVPKLKSVNKPASLTSSTLSASPSSLSTRPTNFKTATTAAVVSITSSSSSINTLVNIYHVPAIMTLFNYPSPTSASNQEATTVPAHFTFLAAGLGHPQAQTSATKVHHLIPTFFAFPLHDQQQQSPQISSNQQSSILEESFPAIFTPSLSMRKDSTFSSFFKLDPNSPLSPSSSPAVFTAFLVGLICLVCGIVFSLLYVVKTCAKRREAKRKWNMLVEIQSSVEVAASINTSGDLPVDVVDDNSTDYHAGTFVEYPPPA